MMSWEGELKARPYTISDAVSKAAAEDWEMNAGDLIKFLRREGFDLYHFACIPSPEKPADALCFSRVPYGGSYRYALDGQSVTFYRSETHEQIAMLKKQGEQWVVARTDHYLTLPELMAISDVGSAIALSKALGYEHITKR